MSRVVTGQVRDHNREGAVLWQEQPQHVGEIRLRAGSAIQRSLQGMWRGGARSMGVPEGVHTRNQAREEVSVYTTSNALQERAGERDRKTTIGVAAAWQQPCGTSNSKQCRRNGTRGGDRKRSTAKRGATQGAKQYRSGREGTATTTAKCGVRR